MAIIYSISMGPITSAMLIGSTVGVIKAANTAMMTIASRHWAMRVWGRKKPILASRYATSGNSKKMPIQNIMAVIKLK